jgi:hypothetical protein
MEAALHAEPLVGVRIEALSVVSELRAVEPPAAEWVGSAGAENVVPRRLIELRHPDVQGRGRQSPEGTDPGGQRLLAQPTVALHVDRAVVGIEHEDAALGPGADREDETVAFVLVRDHVHQAEALHRVEARRDDHLDAHLPPEHRRDLLRARVALGVGADPLRGHDFEARLELPRGIVVAALQQLRLRGGRAEE